MFVKRRCRKHSSFKRNVSSTTQVRVVTYLSCMNNVFFFQSNLERKYDPERAIASEIAAKRKRLSQIQQRAHQTGADSIEG